MTRAIDSQAVEALSQRARFLLERLRFAAVCDLATEVRGAAVELEDVLVVLREQGDHVVVDAIGGT